MNKLNTGGYLGVCDLTEGLAGQVCLTLILLSISAPCLQSAAAALFWRSWFRQDNVMLSREHLRTICADKSLSIGYTNVEEAYMPLLPFKAQHYSVWAVKQR